MASRTLLDLFEERVSASGDTVAIRFREDGLWKSLTWSDWNRSSMKLAAGLVALGVERGDRVAVLSRTRHDWVLADQAILAAGAVNVPVYHAQLARQVRLILADAGATVVFVEDPHQLEKLVQVRDQLPDVRAVVYFDDVAELDRPDRRGRRLVPLSEIRGLELDDEWAMPVSRLRELGARAIGEDPNVILRRRREVTADDVASIVYTAGTTGRPRGVVLTHRNFVNEVEACALALPMDDSDEQLLFLPLSHVFARVTYLIAMYSGCVSTFSRGVRDLLDELATIRPTIFVGVPRIFEKLKAQILTEAIGGKGAIRRRAVHAMVELAENASRKEQRGEKLNLAERVRYGFADRAMYGRIRALFGERLRFAVCGGAPLAEDMAHFFTGAGVQILEGYGLTESCAAVTVNRPDDVRIGTVGRPVSSVEVRLASDGEILLRGPTIMRGYWNDDEASEEILRDGWLHTGDIGEFEGPYLRVTDRKKDLIITAGGKNVAPLPIETRLQAIEYVDRAVVYGDRRKYLCALITLEEEPILTWARDNGLGGQTYEDLRQHPKVYELVRQCVDDVNRDLSSVETIKRFAILDDEFALSSGELTATFKTRRHFVKKKYGAIIESLYEESF